MNRAIDKLIRTLERLATLYDELLACGKEKTELLVASDVEGLEAIHGRETMIVGKLNDLERVKLNALSEAADVCNCTTTPPTLSAIVVTMSEDGDEDEAEAREELLALKERLLTAGKAIASTNRLNEQLCTQSLTHLEVFVGLLTGRSNRNATYNAQGKTRMYNARALVSRSA